MQQVRSHLKIDMCTHRLFLARGVINHHKNSTDIALLYEDKFTIYITLWGFSSPTDCLNTPSPWKHGKI